MLVTRNKYIAERVKLMRSHGINKISFDRFASKKPSWQYEVLEAGFKYNLTDISINYITFCSFEKIFFLNFRNIKDILYKLTYNYDKYRISKNDKFNNYLISNYILSKRIFMIKDSIQNVKYTDLKSIDFPLTSSTEKSKKTFS